MAYHTSTEERPIDIVNIPALEPIVKAKMNKGAFGYLAGGAESEITLRENVTSFEHKKILPRVLRNVEKPDMSTELFGIHIDAPIIAAPIAAHGLVHEQAEKDTVQGVGAAGSIFSLSTYGNATVDEVAQASPDTAKFFQLYMSKDDDFNHWILDMAVNDGYKAIILTADSTLGGYRESDIMNNFAFPLPMKNLAAWAAKTAGPDSGEGEGIAAIYAKAKQKLSLADIKAIKDYTHLPVIVKGVQSPLDIEDLLNAGADGIWVSNHGGRQIDGAPGSFDTLAEIAAVVAKRVPVIFDSGVRRGQHIFKALASGADIVAIGRPMLWGLSLGGVQGVTDVYNHFKKELTIDMQLAGTQTIADVKNTVLADAK
ncbi:lactate oxidase [Periweissella cryptocerci]|uniref:L-lactate oxidase n=1 Tax=Periweissella cryptocerci TaxID=2506420 RepID=A0A4P6YR47_9LACO|nr:alpha-hydroxy-acid oxidizing protein [Periweissella cryptocerci]QBO35090.1 lactate oxidase [Periweissella cryptocerci]